MARKQLGAAPSAATDAVTKAYVTDRVASTRVADGAGIDLTGATTSDVAFQALLTAAAADAAAGAGIVEVYIPPGILSLTTRPTVGAGVTVRGAGLGATTIRSSNASGVLQLTGTSDITIADLTVESTASGTSAIGITTNTYAGVLSRVAITNCRITGATNNAVRFPLAVEDLTFTDNIVEDCAAGFTHYAPTLASGLISTGFRLNRNRFRNVGSTNIQIYGGTNALTVSTVIGVDISGNDLRDFAQTGADGPIPIEPTCVTNIRIANNTIEGPATRGISTGSCVNMTIIGNTITDQSKYAIELNGGRQISIVGNTTENCATFAQHTGDATAVALSDVVIADNTYTGSGLAASLTTSAIHILGGRRVRISGNVFSDWQYLRDAVRIGNGATAVAEDCVVEGNTFIASDANTPITTITVRTGLRTNVVRNAVRINRNLVAGEGSLCVITAVQDAATDDTLIDSNHVQFSGTIAAAPSLSAIGNGFVSAAACPGLTVCRNHVVNGPKGIRLVTNSTDLVVYHNDTFTCSSADTIPATATNGLRTASIVDTNGKTSVSLTATASAVNYLVVRNRGTGGPPELQSAGTDTDIGLNLVSKAGGTIALLPGAQGGAQFRYVASAVNFLIMQGGATGTGVTLNASGTDTNVDMLLVTRGAGVVRANGNPVGVKVAVPASAGATGVVGQWAADASWIYVCTAANTWVRGALATW